MNVLWVDEPDAGVRDGITALVQEVAALRGAVGWLSVPTPEEVRQWLDGLLASRARLVVAETDGTVAGMGAWSRGLPPVDRMGHLRKVMTAPAARGQGVARVVVGALIADAESAGMEVLTLDCRGNNHGALRLYAAAGFVVTGRRPDAIAVGHERFDQVLMHLDLRRGPAGLLRHGSRREGPGSG